jgi:hypothetical protein
MVPWAEAIDVHHDGGHVGAVQRAQQGLEGRQVVRLRVDPKLQQREVGRDRPGQVGEAGGEECGAVGRHAQVAAGVLSRAVPREGGPHPPLEDGVVLIGHALRRVFV